MQPLSVIAAAVAASIVITLILGLLLRRASPALREENARLNSRLAVEEERSSRLAESEQRLQSLTELKDSLDRQLAAKTETVRAMQAALEDLQNRLGAAEQVRERARENEAELTTRLAALEEALEQERKHAAEKLAMLEDARERMTQEFRQLADETLRSHGAAFSSQNKEQMDAILSPLREKLKEFQEGMQAARTESVKERATLGEQIRQLSESSARMSSETSNLTRALKGESQTQGAWGEMILNSILERSGLREGEEYVCQQSHSTVEGRQVRTDVVVHLPGGQRVVIDSKVSLTGFESYVNSTGEAERDLFLRNHLTSMRSHIKTLAGKEYQAAAGSSLDYVIMFVPIEGALAAALQADASLTGYAIDNNVTIATPTTLMIALRTVRTVWQVERRNQNAEAIAERAGRLYDKLVGFMGDMESIRKGLDQARGCYDQAMGKLATGKGNLVSQAEQLKVLGARTSKALPAHLVEEDEAAVVPYDSTSRTTRAGN